MKDHNDRFDTDQKCHDYLVMVRWQGVPQCPVCANSAMNYYISTRNVYKCSACYKQFSVTQGSIFHGSKISLSKWFLAIYLFTTKKRGLSSIQMAEWIDVPQKTAWFMMHRLREALKDENEIMISGIVEADETFVGPKINRDLRLRAAMQRHREAQNTRHGYSRGMRLKKGEKLKRGRKKGSTKEVLQQKALDRGGKKYNSHASDRVPFEIGTVVLGMMEHNGRIVMKKIGNSRACVNTENVYPHLLNHIERKSILITDQLNLYTETANIFVQHLTVNHEEGYVINGIHINNIENAWKHLKKMIDGTYFHLSYHHFDKYLNENTYRWNRRKESRKLLFESFFPLISDKKTTYRRLIYKMEEKNAA